MNPKYRKHLTDATSAHGLRISGRLANAAALIVIVASLCETGAIMGVMPLANFTDGACSASFAAQAGQHAGLGQCEK
jgi:hypothetical protein